MKIPRHYYDPYWILAPFYDSFARIFLIPFGGEVHFREKALDLLDLKAGMKVLELGCGTGTMSKLLAKRNIKVVGVDLSPNMLQIAKQKSNLDCICHDILTFNGKGQFDRVLLSFVLHEMAEDTILGALKTAHCALKPDGQLGILDFSQTSISSLNFILKLYLKITEPIEAQQFVKKGLEYYLSRTNFKPIKSTSLALGMVKMKIGLIRN